MQEAMPENPFVPGFGAELPVTGQRSDVEDPLIKKLSRLQNAGTGMNSACLCGRRGNGKTALLNWLHRKAKEGPPLSHVKFLPAAFETETAYRSAMETVGRVLQLIAGRDPDPVSVRIAGINVQMFSREARESTNVSTARGGLLFTKDKFDKVPANLLARFLGAMHRAGRKVPVAIVLARTPDIEDTLRGGSNCAILASPSARAHVCGNREFPT